MARPKLNEFGFDPKVWKKMDAQIKEWLKTNKELWDRMNKYEKDAAVAFAKTTKSTKEMSASYTAVFDVASKISEELQGQIKTNKLAASIAAGMTSINRDMLKIEGQSNTLSKKKLKSYQGIVNLTDDFVVNMDAIGTDEFRSLDINKQIRDAIKAKLPDEEAYLRSLKAEHDVQKKLNAEITSQADLIKKPFGILDDMVKRIPVFGDMLSKKLDLTGMGEEYAEKFVQSAKAAAEAQKELELNATGFATSKEGKKYGIDKGVAKKKKAELAAQSKSGKMMKKMGPYALGVAAAVGAMAVSAFKFAAEMGVAFSQITPAMLLFKDQTKAMLDEFGSVDDVSAGMLWTMKKASFFSGVQASDMAKMAMLQTSITTDTKAMALDKQAKFMKEIKDQGLSAAKVMGDLASHADMFASFAKDGGKNMEEAAKQAAKMGLSLDATSSVAEGLLDWETSIGKEMEASMILGRSINLDKARQLAYSGDLAAMMTEVKNQAGGEAEFAKMSVVQRRALGDAIGLQGAQLGEFMKSEEGAAEASGKVWYKSFWAIAALLTVVGGLVGMILGGLAPTKLITMALGAKIGAGLGAAIGLIGAGMISSAGDVFSPAKGKTQISPKEGGIFNLSKNDDLMAGPGIASGGGATVVDNSGLESKLDQLISIAAKQPTSELVTDQARRQKSAIEGAFAQR